MVSLTVFKYLSRLLWLPPVPTFRFGPDPIDLFTFDLHRTGSAYLWCRGDARLVPMTSFDRSLWGSVVTWGDPHYSAIRPEIERRLRGVVSITANDGAFAAVLEDGQVVTWGDWRFGSETWRLNQIPGRWSHMILFTVYCWYSMLVGCALYTSNSLAEWEHTLRIEKVGSFGNPPPEQPMFPGEPFFRHCRALAATLMFPIGCAVLPWHVWSKQYYLHVLLAATLNHVA